MKNRSRMFDNSKEYQDTIDAYVGSGFTIKEEHPFYCKLQDSNYGGWGWNIVIFFLTVWWTFFIGNIVYILCSYFIRSSVVELHLKEK